MVNPAAVDARPLKGSLLGIPSEVRLRVYRYLFECSKAILNLTKDRVRGHHEVASKADLDLTCYNSAITQVNKDLRSEALILLQASTVLFARSDGRFKDDHQSLEMLPTGLLAQLKYLSVDYDLVEALPIDDLQSLECVSVNWPMVIKDDCLFDDAQMVEATLHPLMLEILNAKLEHRNTGEGVNKWRQRFVSRNKGVQLLWSIHIWLYKADKGFGRYALIDLEAGCVLRTGLITDSESEDREYDAQLHFEGV